MHRSSLTPPFLLGHLLFPYLTAQIPTASRSHHTAFSFRVLLTAPTTGLLLRCRYKSDSRPAIPMLPASPLPLFLFSIFQADRPETVPFVPEYLLQDHHKYIHFSMDSVSMRQWLRQCIFLSLVHGHVSATLSDPVLPKYPARHRVSVPVLPDMLLSQIRHRSDKQHSDYFPQLPDHIPFLLLRKKTLLPLLQKIRQKSSESHPVHDIHGNIFPDRSVTYHQKNGSAYF